MSFADHDILQNIAQFTQAADKDPALLDAGADDPGPQQSPEQQYNAQKADAASQPIEQPEPQQGGQGAPIDFAGQQGGAPMDAGASAPQPQQTPAQVPGEATPNLMPQPVQALTPQASMNAYQQNNANAQGATNQAFDQQKQGKIAQSEVTQAQNDISAQALPVQNQVDQDLFNTRAAIDDTHMKYTQEAISNSQKMIAQYEQLYQKNPNNFWGNSSTTNKIGAIIGMVGAGLAHTDAAQYFQNIVNNSVHEAQRKEQLLGKIGNMQADEAGMEHQGYKDQVAAVENRKAAAYKLIGNQVEQRMALTKNPMERSKLQETLGHLNLEQAKEFQKASDKQVEMAFKGDQLKIAQQSADASMLASQARMQSANHHAASNRDNITKQAMSAVRGVPAITKVDQRISQLRPAISLLRNNPTASSAQLNQIMVQILNGEIGGRVTEKMLGHMSPQTYMQEFQKAQEKLTNHPQDAHARAFMENAAKLAEQTVEQLEYEKKHLRHDILKPLAGSMDAQQRSDFGYSDEEEAPPEAPVSDADRARQIADKYK